MFENRSDVERPLLSGGLLDSISKFIGGNPDSTKRAFDAALPTCMYSIADRGSTEDGARGLLDGLASGHIPQLETQDLGRTLADPAASDRLLSAGGGFVQGLFGGKSSSVLDVLGGIGGMGRGGASKLMAVVAPLAMGVIGRRARTDSLDARGLSSFLSDQRGKVGLMVPESLRSLLGVRSPAVVREPLREVPRDEVRRDTAGYDEPVYPRVSHPIEAPHRRNIWPWVLGALAALIGIGLLSRTFRRPTGEEITRPATPRVTEPVVATPADTTAIEQLYQTTKGQIDDAARVAIGTMPPADTAAIEELYRTTKGQIDDAASVATGGEPSARAPEPSPEQAIAPPAPEEVAEPVTLRSDSKALKEVADTLSGDEDLPKRWNLDGLSFANGKSDVPASAGPIEDDLVALLEAHPDAKIRIEGHASATGNAEVNQALSEARATAVKDDLVGKGIDSERIETSGSGGDVPLASNASKAGQAENRRVDIVLLSR